MASREPRATSPDVVFYTMDRCAPCEAMKRKLEHVQASLPFPVHVHTVNLSSAGPAAAGPVIRSAPVLRVVKNGQQIVGDVDVEDLKMVLLRSLY